MPLPSPRHRLRWRRDCIHKHARSSVNQFADRLFVVVHKIIVAAHGTDRNERGRALFPMQRCSLSFSILSMRLPVGNSKSARSTLEVYAAERKRVVEVVERDRTG